jgi:hypothetical protein
MTYNERRRIARRIRVALKWVISALYMISGTTLIWELAPRSIEGWLHILIGLCHIFI